jgi:hypothetical protein
VMQHDLTSIRARKADVYVVIYFAPANPAQDSPVPRVPPS